MYADDATFKFVNQAMLHHMSHCLFNGATVEHYTRAVCFSGNWVIIDVKKIPDRHFPYVILLVYLNNETPA